MVIAFRSYTVGTATLSSTVTINKPAGTVAGDYLEVMLDTAAARTFVTLSGWALLPGATNGSQTAVMWKIAGGSEPASYTFTVTGGTTTFRGTMTAHSGVNTVTPHDAAQFLQAAAGTSIVFSGITVSTGTYLKSSIIRVGSAAVVTKPATMTQYFQDNTNTNTSAGAAETAVPGATGSRTWTWVGTSVVGGSLVSLREPTTAQTEYAGILPI